MANEYLKLPKNSPNVSTNQLQIRKKIIKNSAILEHFNDELHGFPSHFYYPHVIRFHTHTHHRLRYIAVSNRGNQHKSWNDWHTTGNHGFNPEQFFPMNDKSLRLSDFSANTHLKGQEVYSPVIVSSQKDMPHRKYCKWNTKTLAGISNDKLG